MALHSNKTALLKNLYGEIDALNNSSEKKIMQLSFEDIKELPEHLHPFHKTLNLEIGIEDLAESIKMIGIMQPIVVTPASSIIQNETGYFILAGHRRTRAAKKAGLESIPAIIEDNCNSDLYDIIVTDTNLQNPKEYFPSELACAYKRQLDALKRQGCRTDLCNAVECNNEEISKRETARDILSDRYNMSPTEISKYIRLLKLSPALLNAVDEKRIPVSAGYQLSFLPKNVQIAVAELKTVSLAQAKKIRKIPECLYEKINTKNDLQEIMKTLHKEEKDTSLQRVFKMCKPPLHSVNLTTEEEKELANRIQEVLEVFIHEIYSN